MLGQLNDSALLKWSDLKSPLKIMRKLFSLAVSWKQSIAPRASTMRAMKDNNGRRKIYLITSCPLLGSLLLMLSTKVTGMFQRIYWCDSRNTCNLGDMYINVLCFTSRQTHYGSTLGFQFGIVTYRKYTIP